jgi:putative CocE/NonD family hydrolase
LKPPSLKAICPWERFTDAYRDLMTSGGIVENGFSSIWLRVTKRVARLGTDIGAQRPAHPLRDSWWEALAPNLEKITVPMLVCASFSDANLHSVGSLRAFERAGSTEKFAYLHRGPKWATFYSSEAKAAQLEFFSKFLREQDIPEPPRVRLEVRENRDRIAAVRTETEWPPQRTEWRELFLADSGRLTNVADGSTGSVTFDLRRNAAAFTARFDTEIEITGAMSLRLWASVDGANDASLFLGVEKWSGNRWVPFEGSYGYGRDRVAIGRQRLSLREVDPAASAPHRPEHTFLTPQLLTEGEVVQLDIALSASATLFRAGESLRLLVAGRYLEPRNPFFGHFPARYVPSPRGTCTLHWGAERPARLEIPVIPAPGTG